MRLLLRLAKWLAILLVLFVALYAIVGFFVVPAVGVRQVEARGREALGVPVEIGDLRFNPFTLRVEAEDISAGEGEDRLFTADGMVADIGVWGSLTGRQYVLDELKLVAPRGNLVVAEDGSLNFSPPPADPAGPGAEDEVVEVVDVVEEPASADPDGGGLPPVKIEVLAIEGGEMRFTDRRIEPAFHREITPIDFLLHDFSTKTEEGKVEFSATGDAGEEVELVCEVQSLRPVRVTGSISLQGLKAEGYRPLIQPYVGAEIGGGELGLAADFDCLLADTEDGTPELKFSDGLITLRDVVVGPGAASGGGDLLSVPQFELRGIGGDLASQQVTVEEIILVGADIDVERGEEGAIRLVEKLMPTPSVEDGEGAAPRADPSESESELGAGGEEHGWAVVLDRVDLESCRVHYRDPEGLDIPAEVDLTLTNFASTLDQESEFTLSITGPDELVIGGKGSAQPEPLRVVGELEISHLTPGAALPIIGQYLDVEEIDFTLDAKTSFSVDQDPATSDAGVQLSGGELTLKDVLIKQAGEDACVDLPSLAVTEIELDDQEMLATVATVHIEGGHTEVVLDSAGELNFSTLMIAPEAPAPDPEGGGVDEGGGGGDGGAWVARVGKLDVEGHQLRYCDEGELDLDLPVSIDLTVSDLDSGAGTLAAAGKVAVRGAQLETEVDVVLDPLKVEGEAELSDLQPGAFLDLLQRYLVIETAAGSVGATAEFTYGEGGVTLTDAALTVVGVELAQPDDEPFLKLPKVEIAGVALDQAETSVEIGKVVLEEPYFGVRKDAEGEINIDHLIVEEPAVAAAEPLEEPDPDAAEAGTEPDVEPSGDGWQIALTEANMTKAIFHFNEEGVTDLPIQFDLGVGGVSNAGGGGELTFAAQLLGEGSEALEIATSLDLKNGDGEGTIHMRGFDLGVVEPWLPDLPFRVNARGIDYDGTIQFANVLAGAPEFSTGGQFALREFALGEAGEDPFVSCVDIEFGEFEFDYPENRAALSSVVLTGLEVLAEIAPDGSLNLIRGFVGEEVVDDGGAGGAAVEESVESGEAAQFSLEVGHLVVTESRVAFVDQSIVPPFEKALEDLEIDVSDVVVGGHVRATFDVTASIDHHAPFQLDGYFDDRISGRYPEWHLILKNLPVDDLAPYTRKYFGRDIESGALSLKQDIVLGDEELRGELKFFFAKLKVGEVVETPDLVNVPVGAALFVLSRNGRIDEEIKFSGDLNDPDFHFLAVFGNALGNVVGKIALMPAGVVTRVTQGVSGLFLNRRKQWIVSQFEFSEGSFELTPEIRAELDAVALAPLTAEPYDDLRLAMPDGIGEEQMDKLAGLRVSAVRAYMMEEHGFEPHRIIGMPPGAFPGRQPWGTPATPDRYLFWIERLDTYKAGSESSSQQPSNSEPEGGQ